MADQAMPQPAIKHREKKRGRETRLPIEGRVRLISRDSKQREFEGELMDISIHGFRVRHRPRDLEDNQEYRVIYPWGEVFARLIWHRTTGEWTESGFRLSY